MALPIVSQDSVAGNNPNGEKAPSLWALWWNAITLVQPAFSYVRAFFWFAVAVAGMTVRTEMLGVTSIVRAFKLQPKFYGLLLKSFHSGAVSLDRLSALWTQAVLRLFPSVLRINGRPVLIGDGIKVAKRGKKMPAVKRLHQESENKAEFIQGHSLQAICLLVQAARSAVAVPLAIRIHEGVVWSNRHKKTLLDKMLSLLGIIDIGEACYFVGDAYYAARKIIIGLRQCDDHVITRVKKNAVAHLPYEHRGPRKRGRPRLYGERFVVASLLRDRSAMRQAASPAYGEENVQICYAVRDLRWRPSTNLVRFVAVQHPTRGSCLLMCTDTTLDPIEIIRSYALRWKIEHSFKQASQIIGAFAYHFWMKAMTPLTRRSGDQYLHRKPLKYRDAVRRKLHAYHVFLQAGAVAQGLLQYLSIAYPERVWNSFGSWLRTIRPGIPPSEFVTAEALRQTLPDFLVRTAEQHAFAKFITERQDPDTAEMFRMAA